LVKIITQRLLKITDFGAFVEFLPGQQGLLHISQIDTKRIKDVKDVLKEGDEIRVRLMKIENGKMSLSRKVILQEKEEAEGRKQELEKDTEE
jgi:polyribonucleotide nucleotidyltransferase